MSKIQELQRDIQIDEMIVFSLITIKLMILVPIVVWMGVSTVNLFLM